MSHYFTNDKELKHNIEKKDVIIKTVKFTFFTDNGVFSKKGLDFGTRTLLESLPNNLTGDILDFGCGYGPIGIYVKKMYDCNVDMIDINERSIDLTIKNAELNNVKINAFISDVYTNINKKYNYIITNPPIRVGKELLYKILFEAKKYLKEKGKIFLVINKDQGAKSLMKDLEKEYKVNLINKNKGFFIICAEK